MSHSFNPNTALTRDYPPAPWMLWGSMLAASFAIRAEAVAALVPPALKLVRVPGGLTMGFLAVCRYGPGSTLEYSELLAGVLTRHGARPGPYVTHIAVDNPRSQRGGYALWRLPKQLWRFDWEFDPLQTSVQVWDGLRLVCVISGVPANARLWPMRTRVPFLQPLDDGVALLVGDAEGRVAWKPWRLQLNPDGPLAAFKPVGPLLTTVARGRVRIEPLQPLPSTTDES